MARNVRPERLEQIYRAVAQNPGERAGWIAHQLGLHRSEVTRALPALEDEGYLLCEDEEGGLWLFERES